MGREADDGQSKQLPPMSRRKTAARNRRGLPRDCGFEATPGRSNRVAFAALRPETLPH